MTFSIADLSVILTTIAGFVGVYVAMKVELTTLKTELKNMKSVISQIKSEKEKLEVKVEDELKELSKIDAMRTLALQENTLAIRELRNFVKKLEDKLDNYTINIKHG